MYSTFPYKLGECFPINADCFMDKVLPGLMKLAGDGGKPKKLVMFGAEKSSISSLSTMPVCFDRIPAPKLLSSEETNLLISCWITSVSQFTYMDDFIISLRIGLNSEVPGNIFVCIYFLLPTVFSFVFCLTSSIIL